MQGAGGYLLRGVVLRTYAIDDPSESVRQLHGQPSGVYCDVLLYTAIGGARTRYIDHCLVTQERSGLHDGSLWIPRATTMALDGAELNATTTDPAEMDGDHVLIGFIDDDATLPVILRSIPHPRADHGEDTTAELGAKRNRTFLGDKAYFEKHHGTRAGIDKDGNYLVDSRRANSGVWQADGTEPTTTPTSSQGNQTFKVPENSKFAIEVNETTTVTVDKDKVLIKINDTDNQVTIDGASLKIEIGGATLELTDSGGSATLKLGDGGENPVVYSEFAAAWNTWKSALEIWAGVATAGGGFITPLGPAFMTNPFPTQPLTPATVGDTIDFPGKK